MLTGLWTRLTSVFRPQRTNSWSHLAMSTEIIPHPETHKPTQTWEKLSVKQTVNRVTPLSLDTPIYGDRVRFVCMSDTHNTTGKLSYDVPHGDVFLHAGDFTNIGQIREVEKFNEFLGTLSHKYKVVIAGNHDLSLDKDMLKEQPSGVQRFGLDPKKVQEQLDAKNVENVCDLFTNCIYLEDSEVTLFGLRIYGSPWQPEFCDWGFNLPRGQPCLDKWNLIPEDVDVLITHGPPIGHGDRCHDGLRAGCIELLSTIQKRVKPKYHIFGHIHEGYGVTTDGFTTYINASTCTLRYRPDNPPVIFDLPLPEGTTKEEFLNS